MLSMKLTKARILGGRPLSKRQDIGELDWIGV